MKRTVAIGGAFLALSVGCTSLIREEPLTNGSPGISYYLPKRLHKVSYVVSRDVDADDPNYEEQYTAALEALLTAARDHEVAGEVSAAKDAELEHEKRIDDKEKTPDSAQKKLRAESEAFVAKTDLDSAIGAYEKKKKEFAKIASLKGSGDGHATGECKVSLSIEPQPLVPDSTQNRIANIHHLFTRDDYLTISTTASGLLSGADGASTDKTGDVLIAIAEAISVVTTGTGSARLETATPAFTPKKPAPPRCKVGSYVQVVDFSDPTIVSTFNDSLQDRAPGFSLYGPDLPKTDYNVAEGDKTCPNQLVYKLPFTNCDGLAYRRDLPYLLGLVRSEVKYEKDEKGDTVQKVNNVVEDITTISMPQGSETAYVPYNVGWFVKNQFNVTFQDGMLVKSEVDKPSELLSLAKLPVDMARRVMTVLTEVLQFRVNYSGGQTELNETEASRKRALIERDTAQVKALTDYEAALKARIDAGQAQPRN
jgi:hypothetical protein